MTPTKRKSVNKRLLGEISPYKEVRYSDKNKQPDTRKEKLPDKLGPQWSKGEIQRFYKAYRLYGKNWKKVAAAVRDRSMKMVEALYLMNRAYLSLPEGTASVFGLIAMMTDHYSVLEGIQSAQDINYAPEFSRKSQKRKLEKVGLPDPEYGVSHFHSIESTDGCLSLLKKACIDGGQPRAVGKRTPRVPVSYILKKDHGENYASPESKGQKSEADDNDEIAHVAALALTEPLHRGSPRVSHTPHKKPVDMLSPNQSWDRMSDPPNFDVDDASVNEIWLESGLGSRDVDAEVDPNARITSSSVDLEGVGTVEIHRKGRKFYGKKVRAKKIGNNESNDGGELCYGTEGLKGTVKGKVDNEVSNSKINGNSPQSHRRHKKLFFGDELDAVDALQKLANLSFIMTESSAQQNEQSTIDLGKKSSLPKALFGGQHRDERKPLVQEEGVLSAIYGVKGYNSRNCKLGKNSDNFANPAPEAKQLALADFELLKKKSKNVDPKASNYEARADSRHSILFETEASDEGESKSMAPETAVPSKRSKPNGVLDGSVAAAQITGSTTEVSVAGKVILPIGKRSRCKMDLKRAMMPKEGRYSEKILEKQSDSRELNLEEKLSHCLSSHEVRRWSTYEWFYSAIDYPWFANKEFVEYLNHVGLGHIPRLTRVEWGVIRSSLGKPGRFSPRFLHEEREKLEQYRESVRKHYSELRSGTREGLPTDLAKPLSVGQQVLALHPKTREICDGTVLVVDHDRCRVQFDCSELGVEFVQDIDCMPLNPLDNMPEALRRQKLQVEEDYKLGFPSTVQQENGSSTVKTLVNQPQEEVLQAKAAAVDAVTAQEVAHCHPSTIVQAQVKEVDTKPSPGLTCALDKKASSALSRSRQHNAYQGSIIDQIVGGSRLEAHVMVDTAVQVISSTNEGEDALVRIVEALDCLNGRGSLAEPGVHLIRSPEHVNGSLQHHEPTLTSELHLPSDASGPTAHDDSATIEVAIPSELIKSCVATLLMIQKCSQQQYPPADVSQIIDSALTSLRPCCPQNLPLYRDIQMCMGRIKTQILSLIPT